MSCYEVISIYHDMYENVMMDEDGNIIYDIYRIISPNKFHLLKEKRGTYYIPSKENPDVMYEFVFPLDEEDEDEQISMLLEKGRL